MEALKKQVLAHIKEKPSWTVYTIASILNMKAEEIYLKLDQKTRLMLIREGRLLAVHATIGLYEEFEPEHVPKKSTEKLFFELFGGKK